MYLHINDIMVKMKEHLFLQGDLLAMSITFNNKNKKKDTSPTTRHITNQKSAAAYQRAAQPLLS